MLTQGGFVPAATQMPNHPFIIHGIDHIVLRVRELPRSLAFYCELLGCTIEREQPQLGLTQLRAGSSLIDLVTLDRAAEQVAIERERARQLPHAQHDVVDPVDDERALGHVCGRGNEGALC